MEKIDYRYLAPVHDNIGDKYSSRSPHMGAQRGCNERMYVVCKEHVELAIDMFVDEFEDAPDIVDLKETEFADWDPPAKCAECEQAAQFLVV